MRKNGFYLILLLIFILFISRDKLISLTDNKKELESYFCSLKHDNIIKEYQELADILNLDNVNHSITYAKIINRNIYEFYEKLEINKGSNDNIKKDSIVISSTGVIGLIKNVNKNSSEVILLTNPEINLSVKVGNNYGILSAINHQIIVKNIKLTEEIELNSIVETSGLTDILGGIKIGTVKKINKDNLELEYILEIEPFVDYKNLSIVGVIN